MRLLPILTSILVAAALYFVIMERDTLLALAGNEATPNDGASASQSAQTGQQPVSVVAMHSVAQTVESGIILRGRTEAARKITVRAETNGLVVSEPLRKGSIVEAGQTLCELDPGTRGASLTEAKARLAEADANNKVASSLSERGFASETQAISRQAQLQSAMAAVEQAEKELSRLQIKAPFSGLLESDTAELGELLQPGSACATIIDLDPIKLVGFAPERDIARLTLGAAAGARLVTGEEIRGSLTFLSRSADEQTRTYRVEVTVPNTEKAIRDGATAEIFIALEGQPAHLLPQDALTLDDGGRLGVRTARDNIAQFMPVTIVRDTAEGVWVLGLPEELDVIVVGQEYVVDGRAIQVTMQETAK